MADTENRLLLDKTGQAIATQLATYNNFLAALHGNLQNLNTTDKSSLVAAVNETLGRQKREPLLKVSAESVKIGVGSTAVITCEYRGTGTISATSSDTSIATAAVSGNKVTITHVAASTAATITISLSATDDYYADSATVTVERGIRYGIRIKKGESDPSARVEYLFDAVGKKPAKMDFSGNLFDYGDWGDAWFVKLNKPCMVKNDGTVDYYLDPNDYDRKEDGTASDVSNVNYNGNAMAQIPLCYIKRYEDNTHIYEIVSDIKYDDYYEAFAHVRADGTIAPFFFWSMFGGSGNASKIRSLAGQARAAKLTAQQGIDGAKANGSKWYTHTWSKRECIRTLLVLMGKSTDTQSVFGTGNCRSGSEGSVLATGTLKKMGQFFGYSGNTQQVKVFHIEAFWGDQWDRTAGIIYNGGKVYAKMTPEGAGYRVTDTTGYTNTGITLAGTSSGYISQCSCSKYGIIPKQISGSGTTYYCDSSWFGNSELCYLICGASANYDAAIGGGFAFAVGDAPSNANWNNGCGLSLSLRKNFGLTQCRV